MPRAEATIEAWRRHWQDYYAVLGVGRGATVEQIRRAYDERSRDLDPARYDDAPPNVRERARTEFELLSQAYRVLSDEGLRQLYDEELERVTSFRAGAARAAGVTLAPRPAPAEAAPPEDAAPTVAVEEPPPTPREPPGGRVGLKPWGIPAILLALALPGLFWISGFFVELSEEQSAAEIAIGLVSTIVFKDFLLIGLAGALAIWRYKLSWGALGFRPFDQRQWWLPLAAVGVTYVGLIAYGAVLSALGASDPDQEAVESFFDSRALLPLTFFTLVVMAPLSEETFFRGFIFGGLVRPFGAWPAIVASGLLFGAFHVSGLDTLALLPPIGLIGAAFAWIYFRTGSLWLSIAAHALFNGLSFAVMAAM